MQATTINPFVVLDPHRHVEQREMIFAGVCVLTVVYLGVVVRILLHQTIVGTRVLAIGSAYSTALDVMLEVAREFVVMRSTLVTELIDLSLLKEYLSFLLSPTFFVGLLSLVNFTVLLALSLTVLSQYVFRRRELFRSFEKRAMACYFVMCVCVSVAAAFLLLAFSYPFYAVTHALIKSFFRQTELLSLQQIIVSAFPCLYDSYTSLAGIVLAYVVAASTGAIVYYTFYAKIDAFDEPNQDGLTAERLRDTFRFTRSLAAFSFLGSGFFR